MNAMKRGVFIVIEGVDRSGKSTQCRKLVESLTNMNISAELMVFPDRTTKTGQLINEYLSNKECKLNDQTIHLLFSANRWENVGKIKTTLQQGTTLIVDRYSYSGIVFSAAKDGMSIDWCKQPEVGLPKPDKVVLLTISDEVMMKRPGFGNERYENKKMQNKVSEFYKQLVDDNWSIIDASGTLEEVHQVLLKHVLETINKFQNAPLGTLEFNKINDMQNKHNDYKENCNSTINVNYMGVK